MVIWSILTQQAWEELQRKGRLRATTRHAEEDYMAAYVWMGRQMERRLATPRPSKDSMPVWVWWQWWGDRRRPDLRASGHLPKGVGGVRVECRVGDDRVLLSDFELWHYVLNYWYLPRTEKSWERILDLSWTDPGNKIVDPAKDRSIQGTMWELLLDDVVESREFTAR